MFDRIKKALARPAGESSEPRGCDGDAPISEWAATRGLVFSAGEQAGSVALEGKVHGRRWRLERGRPTRDYIVGEELRARAQLGVHEDIAAMVINRSLSDRLEQKAYERSTHSLQTTIDSNLPHEVRWLAMYRETAWQSLPEAFWNRYSVYTDRPDLASSWIDGGLAALMLDWPKPGPSNDVPFMMLLMQGKAYLRMEYRPADLATLQHAALIFTSACESALSSALDVSLD